jgi:hypothetical protein
MRVGEAELHQLAALIDRRGGHRGRARQVTQFQQDARIADELLRNRNGLPRIAAAVLEVICERAALDAALAVDLVECEIESALPLRAVLTVLSRQRTAHTDQIGLAGGRGSARRGAGDKCCHAPRGSDQRQRLERTQPRAARLFCYVLHDALDNRLQSAAIKPC